MWKEGREKLKGGRVPCLLSRGGRSGFKSRRGILNARKSRDYGKDFGQDREDCGSVMGMGNAVKMSIATKGRGKAGRVDGAD